MLQKEQAPKNKIKNNYPIEKGNRRFKRILRVLNQF
jgi:hypothetical protein